MILTFYGIHVRTGRYYITLICQLLKIERDLESVRVNYTKYHIPVYTG
jgi:hypothetical protein